MLTLDQMCGDWLAPRREEDFSLPAITSFRAVVQAAWDACGIQNWVCAPTALPTPMALLFEHRDGRWRRSPRPVEYRWKPWEIERRGHGMRTATRLPEGRAAVLQRLAVDRPAHLALLVTGLPRVWRFTDYWNLPPEDVPMFNVRAEGQRFVLTDTKTFGRAEVFMPGALRIYGDLHAWLDGEEPCEYGRVGIAEFEVCAGDEVTWHAVQGCEERLPALDAEEAWESARTLWERTWAAAFTAGNSEFSGHLPAYRGPLERLHDMGVMTLLMTRRLNPPVHPRASIATGGQCIWSEDQRPLERAYVVGGPEGAPTTSFLWELEFQAPLLARLDPAVLRAQLDAFLRVDLRRHWGVETVSGRGAGMFYGVNPGAFLSCVRDYVRITGDRAWALARLHALRDCARPEMTDYGDCQNILECVSTYEHTIAAFNALDVQGLRFLADLTGEPAYADAAAAKAAKVLALYAGGPFACLQPDGSRRAVRTILDFVYVGRCLAGDIPPDMKRGMARFFLDELRTDDWLYALSPRDPDALTTRLPTFQTFRADHQATGAYDGWPARAASVLLRFGFRDEAMAWLRRVEGLTREGPFGQAHFIHPDGARKASFFNGNMNLAAAGCGFATTVLEEVAGG